MSPEKTGLQMYDFFLNLQGEIFKNLILLQKRQKTVNFVS